MKINLYWVVLVTFVFAFCISLTGCKQNDISIDEEEKYSLVSDSDRLVFKKDDNYEIYYLSENVIEKIEKAKEFSSEYYANEYYSKQNALMYNSVRCIGNIVVFEMNNEYLNENKYLTKTDLIYTMEESGFTKIDKK